MVSMLRALLGSLLGLCVTLAAHAQVRCASYLGACSQRFPCDAALAALSGLDKPCMGWLHTTFGTRCECPRRFLTLAHNKVARVHVINGSCFPERGRRCAKDEVFANESIPSADKKLRTKNPAILRKYRRKLQELRRVLSVASEGTDVYISPCLECPVGDRARRVLVDETRKVFPSFPIVDSVLTQRCLRGTVCEKHGSRANPPAPCIVDTDGESYLDMNMPAWFERTRQCEQQHLWTLRFNMLCPEYTSFVPPLRRTCGPTRDDLRVLREWLFYDSGL